MSPASDLAYTSAAAIALGIRRRELSPVEVLEAFIERVEQRNPSPNAFVFTGFDAAPTRSSSRAC